MRQIKISQSITTRDSKSLETYLQNINKIDLLTVEEEEKCCKKIKEGDQEALDTLVKANLRFVVSVAKQYQNQGVSLSDLINEGNLGLIDAAIRFDGNTGFRFISYAVWWIRQKIFVALSEQSRIIRIPLNKISDIYKIDDAISALKQKLEREPTDEEISYYLKMEESLVSMILKVTKPHTSLDMTTDDGNYSFLETIESTYNAPDGEINQKESLSIDLNNALNILNEKERDIIKMFYGIGFDKCFETKEIGAKLGLSPERVRQKKNQALLKLKKLSNLELLKTHL